jgi:DNA helicase HerA-like ATPase
MNLPDLPRKARAKTERPLFAVAVRLSASSPAILDRLQGAFLPQLESAENGLVPMGGSYPVDAVLGRFTRSEGMLLTLSELSALAHLPNPALVSQGLEVAEKGAPPRLAVERILCLLGSNDYRGAETPVGIPADQLSRHLAILGGTGSGKTNLMKVAFSPLLEQGYGIAVLDPKGDLAQGFLDLVPQHRVNDVIWFDPTDREYPPALNILQASGDLSPDELAGELMIGLKRIFTGSSEFGPGWSGF